MQVLGRIFIIDNQIDSLEVWVHELVPLNGERSGWEKVTEYFSHFDVGTWRELLVLPGNDPVQCLFKGEYFHTYAGFVHGHFQIATSMSQPIPADWLDDAPVMEGNE